MTETNGFQPDWISAPGDTIADILEERNLSRIVFARRLETTPERANQLLDGRTPITSEIAQRLAEVLGSSAAFWIVRERQYRDGVARLERELQGIDGAEWLRELPLKEMATFGWLDQAHLRNDEIGTCLGFFGVPSIAAWRSTYADVLAVANFRTSSSFGSQPGAVAAWLRQGEIESESIDCRPWDASRFRETLKDIRSLTRRKDPDLFTPELKRRCAECGVAVAIVRAPKECKASGATRFLSPSKALLLLSFRYLSDDHFWFTFFHEAGHLLLHSKKAMFLEGTDMISNEEEEKEANKFAARTLIPPEFQAAMRNLGANAFEVIRFAVRAGISPGIVVGQLQHHGQIEQKQLNSLKRRFAWGDD